MTKNILVFGAHPDDCEIGMGGTINKLSKSGYKIHVADLTQGEMSSNGNIFIRKKESEKAQEILGIKTRENLMLPDRGIECSKKNVEKVANIIRKYKPDAIFYPSSIDPHPDHVAASNLISESIFHAKLIKFESNHSPVTVNKIYMYHINEVIESDFYIDISQEFGEKIKALESYESQFFAGNGQATRLTNGFIKNIESNNSIMGYKCGVKYAEGFITVKPILIKDTAMLEVFLND